jgi:uncharacterized protein (DUF1778 family)
MHEKRTRGRPKKDASMTSRMEIRCTPERHSAFKRAASIDGANLSEWVLTQCQRREDEIKPVIAAVDASKKGKRK